MAGAWDKDPADRTKGVVRPGTRYMMISGGLELPRRAVGASRPWALHPHRRAGLCPRHSDVHPAQTGSFTRRRRQIGPREQVAAILLFLVMAFMEESIAQQHTPMSARIIASCAAGLLAGPVAGAAVGLGSTLIAYALQSTPPAGYGLAMLAGGVAGGFVAVDVRVGPPPGHGSGARPLGLAPALRRGRGILCPAPPGSPAAVAPMEAQTALINGVGVALVLQVVAQVRVREESARAVAMQSSFPPGADEPAFPVQRAEHHRGPVRPRPPRCRARPPGSPASSGGAWSSTTG